MALVAVTCLFSAAARAQPQSETISQLTERLTACLKPHGGVYGGVGFTNLKIKKIDACSVTVTFEQRHLTRNKLFYTMTMVLPTDGILISDTGAIAYKDQVIEYTTASPAPNIPEKKKYVNSTPDILIKEDEEGQAAKIQQMMHGLAAFCNEHKTANEE